jgi:long-subunit fatty acid transport protein
MKEKKVTAVAGLLIFALILPTGAGAQLIGALTLERLASLDTPGTGARPFAMGGAYSALSDDLFGIVYNPAGLAMIGKREVSIGIHQTWQDISQSYDGNPMSTSDSYTSFGHIGAAFPYSSYTSDIVFGFGIFRVGSSNLEYIRAGRREDLGGTIENMLFQSGSLYHYRFSLAAVVSEYVSIGGTFVLWDQSPEFTETLSFRGAADSSYTFIDDVSANLDGISFEFGMMAEIGRYLRAGLVMTTPVWLSLKGNGVEYYYGTWPDGEGWDTEPYYFYIEDEFTLPMTFRGGLAFQAENLVISVESSYADYRQTKYNGRRIFYEVDPGIDVLKQVWSYGAGAELTIPGTTLSLRGGYAYHPLPMRGFDEITYIEEDVDEFWLSTEWDFYNVSEERHFYSAGIGYLIDGATALDVCYTRGSFERESPFLSEKREIDELIASISFGF